MNSIDIVVKTTAGADELKSRSRKLPPRLRTMLIMIDGTLSVGHLQQSAASLGVPADFLESLEQQGFVAFVPSSAAAPAVAARAAAPEVDRFRLAQRFMNDTAVDALGFRAFFFTLKLEKCFTLADLIALMPGYSKAITKGSGDEIARVLSARAREMLQ